MLNLTVFLLLASRQKQQIFQLHARIRENELRAQQFLQNQRGPSDEPYMHKTKVGTTSLSLKTIL